MNRRNIRRDSRNQILREGESERKKEHRYCYRYTDKLGRRACIYARNLAELRQKEDELRRDILDGIDVYTSSRVTLNDTFDRYIKGKSALRDTTLSGYYSTYNHLVRDTFGTKKLRDIRYSDVKQFYLYLIEEQGLSIATVDSVHCILHPTFDMAVRDDVIRKNPSDGVMGEVIKETGLKPGVRHALTGEQQKALMKYLKETPEYLHWWPIFCILLGTGCRIGEILGLTWNDIDFDGGFIKIDHAVSYYQETKTHKCAMHVHKTKTAAGVRLLPMLKKVRTAFEMLKEEQDDLGPCESVIDGYSGFVFRNRFGRIMSEQSVDRVVKRIIKKYNKQETEKAEHEDREAVTLPNFSCHYLRHTYTTRLCERVTNVKAAQYLLGHADVQTTLNKYAEATEQSIKEAIEAVEDSGMEDYL